MSNQQLSKPRAPRNQGPSALDPSKPALTQPYKRLVDEGFITELVVKFTAMGITMCGKPDSRMVGADPSAGLTTDVYAPLGVLLAASEKGNLIPKRGDKKKSGKPAKAPLPEKSLCKGDFVGSDAELLARAKLVASKTGGTSLVGRVRSLNAFDGTVTTSFQDWWAKASAESRASALVVPSRRKELTDADVSRLSNLECPFRGTAAFHVAHDEGADDSEDEENPRETTARN